MGILLYVVALLIELSGRTISSLLVLFFPGPKARGKDTAYCGLQASKTGGEHPPLLVSPSLDISSVELTLSFPLANQENQPLFLRHILLT